MQTAISFTAHNIRLDDGTYTKPEAGASMDVHPWFLGAKRLLEVTFPGDRSQVRIGDLGCLEGGYTVEFARMGFRAVGIDVRESNIAACNYVKSRVNLPNLEFVRDDVWNLDKHGSFDVIFCCGLFYHLDKPREFLSLLSKVTRRMLILQTHFSEAGASPSIIRPRRLRRAISRVIPLRHTGTTTHKLSFLTDNEGLPGRWFSEFASAREFRDREKFRWASWSNRRSFWIQREYLLQAIKDCGFSLVLEQFDNLGPDIACEMTRGSYRYLGRGTFIGIKTA